VSSRRGAVQVPYSYTCDMKLLKLMKLVALLELLCAVLRERPLPPEPLSIRQTLHRTLYDARR
jgi:hypothetical protein